MASRKANVSMDFLRHHFDHSIISIFTEGVPKSIQKQYEQKYNNKGDLIKNKLVPIDTMLATIFASTVSGTSIQAATENMGEIQSQFRHSALDMLNDIEPDMNKLPNACYVRNSMKLWEPKNIRPRFRNIIKQQYQTLKYSDMAKLIHSQEGNDGFSVAFDITEIKYYSKNTEDLEFITSSSKKGGSKYKRYEETAFGTGI